MAKARQTEFVPDVTEFEPADPGDVSQLADTEKTQFELVD